jgi:hypothetical protein
MRLGAVSHAYGLLGLFSSVFRDEYARDIGFDRKVTTRFEIATADTTMLDIASGRACMG